MKIRWMSLLPLALFAAMLPLAGCGGDDTPTDPNAGLHQIYIRFSPGQSFTYDRWDLDASSQPITSTRRDYQISYKDGVGLVGAYEDWVYRIGRDMATSAKDTLYMRAENRTSSTNNQPYTQNLMAYGFANKLMTAFIQRVQTAFPTLQGDPSVPAPKWDVMAQYYDGSGKALNVGTEWFLTSENGEDLNFTVNGSPIPVNCIIKGKYDAREVKLTANNKEVLTWECTITATFNILGSLKLIVPIHVWFSDDPDAQVQLIQESANITIPVLGNFSLPGEKQLLKSWI
jgi:hypothetical protein